MCTAISINSKQNEILLGRTLDFYHDFDLEICIIPKNYEWHSIITSRLYRNKYSFIGTAEREKGNYLCDGMNEKGLGVAALYFPEHTNPYKKAEVDQNAIANIEVVTYLLGNCENTNDIITIIPTIHIIEEDNQSSAPLHWIASDKTGKTISIEQTESGLHVINNPVGVLTNSPEFNWHLTNLRNYMNLSSKQLESVNWDSITLNPFGQGLGSFGLPGDFTSPSRFVRMAFAKNFIDLPETKEETIITCFELMKLVSIPKGLILTQDKSTNYTQYTIFMNLNTGDYYFNTYLNNTIKKANINDIDCKDITSLGKLKCNANIEHL